MGIVLVSRYYATLRSTGLGGTLDTQRYVHTNIARDRNFFPWSPCSLFWVFLKSRPTHFLMWFLKEYAPCLTKDTRIKSNDISSIMLSMNATMLFKKGRQMCWIMHSNKCTISTDKTVDCCHFCFFCSSLSGYFLLPHHSCRQYHHLWDITNSQLIVTSYV